MRLEQDTVDGPYKRVGGLYPGGLISEIIYSLANEWAYIRWGLKPGRAGGGGEGFKVGFYGMSERFSKNRVIHVLWSWPNTKLSKDPRGENDKDLNEKRVILYCMSFKSFLPYDKLIP